jgi:hypothetical protein
VGSVLVTKGSGGFSKAANTAACPLFNDPFKAVADYGCFNDLAALADLPFVTLST